MSEYRVLGMMTGGSMDGIDMAYCRIRCDENYKWSYSIEVAECIPLAAKWKQRLKALVLQNAVSYLKTDVYFGHYLGETARQFIERHQLLEHIDFIASHGQSIFHQPENQLTSQIGDGAAIAAETGMPVICNFRTLDIALGGQGTPMAPVIDKLMFPEYAFCLNLGGVANISFKHNHRIIGFDICAVNSVLNSLADTIGLEMDKDGEIARSGKVHNDLLEELNQQWYYDKPYPKSIGGGWISKVFLPVFRKFRIPIEDSLRTATEHISTQIAKDIHKIYVNEGISPAITNSMLVTGGGAFNKFLLEQINLRVPVTVVVPDPNTIKFKEALLVALMGVLRLRGEANMFASVTGARADSCGGEIYQSLIRPLRVA